MDVQEAFVHTLQSWDSIAVKLALPNLILAMLGSAILGGIAFQSEWKIVILFILSYNNFCAKLLCRYMLNLIIVVYLRSPRGPVIKEANFTFPNGINATAPYGYDIKITPKVSVVPYGAFVHVSYAS